jgi:arylsulfatase
LIGRAAALPRRGSRRCRAERYSLAAAYERGLEEGGNAMDFLAQNIWLLVPIQGKIKGFFTDFEKFLCQPGSSLNPSGSSYGLLRQQDALKRLK